MIPTASGTEAVTLSTVALAAALLSGSANPATTSASEVPAAEAIQQVLVDNTPTNYSTASLSPDTGNVAFQSASEVTAFEVPAWYKYVSRRLSELAAGLYDFTGVSVPTREVVSRAWSVAASVLLPDTPPPAVVPSEEGTVVFIWRRSNLDLEVEVGSEDIT